MKCKRLLYLKFLIQSCDIIWTIKVQYLNTRKSLWNITIFQNPKFLRVILLLKDFIKSLKRGNLVNEHDKISPAAPAPHIIQKFLNHTYPSDNFDLDLSLILVVKNKKFYSLSFATKVALNTIFSLLENKLDIELHLSNELNGNQPTYVSSNFQSLPKDIQAKLLDIKVPTFIIQSENNDNQECNEMESQAQAQYIYNYLKILQMEHDLNKIILTLEELQDDFKSSTTFEPLKQKWKNSDKLEEIKTLFNSIIHPFTEEDFYLSSDE